MSIALPTSAARPQSCAASLSQPGCQEPSEVSAVKGVAAHPDGLKEMLEQIMKLTLGVNMFDSKEGGAGGDGMKQILGALQNAIGAMQGDTQQPASPEQHEARLEAESTLERHEDVFKHVKSVDDLQKMADDPSTPPDLRKALNTVLSDDVLRAKFDGKKADNKFSDKDIKAFANDPELIAYNQAKAQHYADNYIPSGDGGKTTEGRPITENDAKSELYKYSDYLPKNVSLDDLQKIVDGTGGEGKCPPQLIAAAQYYTQHPDEWKTLNHGKDKVSQAEMKSNIHSTIELTQDQKDAGQRVVDDPNHVFFDGKGNLSRDKLKAIVDDPKSAPEDKKAAQKMLDDPVLFGLFDNSKNGENIHGIKKVWLKTDDGQVGRGDADRFKSKLSEPTAAAPAHTHKAESAEDAHAASDMLSGEMDQPEIKKAKGGALKDVVNGLMKVGSFIMKVGSKILQKLGELEIPGLSQLAAAGAVGLRAAAGGVDVGRAALNGGDVKAAGINAAIATAGAAAGSFVPGGSAMVKGAAGVGSAVGKGAVSGGVDAAIDSL